MLLSIGNCLLALCGNVRIIAIPLCIARFRCLLDHLFIDMRIFLDKQRTCCLEEILLSVQLDIRHHKIDTLQMAHIRLEQLRIIRYNRTVIAVCRAVFIQIIRHARIENCIDALAQQVFYVTVHELSRITDGIRRNRVLTLCVHGAGRNIRQHNFKIQMRQERVPERQQFKHIESKRNADSRLARLALAVLLQAIELVLIQIRQLELISAAKRTFTAIAGDKFAAAREHGNRQGTVIGAHAALDGGCFMCKVFQLIQRNQRAGLFLVCHCVQGCAIRAHQAGNHRTGDISANFHFKRAQNRIIQERTALYHDVLAEIVRRMRTNNFIQRIFDNTDGQTGRNGVNACAVLLRLLDRRVHKYGAARAEVNRMLCKQTQAAKFFDAVSHRAREGLNKRAAAGGARLIQRNIVDTIVGNLKALDVLSANINDKVNIRLKMTRCLKMRHGFNKTMIDAKRIENQRFTIACDGRTGYANAVSAQLIQLDELFSDDINRIALVRAVIVKQNLMVLTDQHQFCCRRAAVNAKICLAAVHRHVFAHDVM